MTLSDEEIRIEALKINAAWCGVVGPLAYRKGDAFHISLFSPTVDNIVEYVKTGKKPVISKEE